MNCDYPILRIRKIGTKFIFELTDPPSLQIVGIERKKAKFTTATRTLIFSYGRLVELAGSTDTKDRAEFRNTLENLSLETGKILNHALKNLGFDLKKTTNLALALDDETVRIPWELAYLPRNAKTGCRDRLFEKIGVGRLRVVKGDNWFNYPDRRRKNRALVIGNNYRKTKRRISPLDCAETEADKIASILHKHYDVKLLKAEEVTKKAVLDELKNGVDVFHFTGHGEMSRNNGKLLLNDHDLSAKTFNKESHNCSAPRLTFFNACESCIDTPSKRKTAGVPHSWAYAMAQQGGNIFIGTLWSVVEPPAGYFAEVFYKEFFSNKSNVSQALENARVETFLKENCKKYTNLPTDYTWPGYMLYGFPTLTKEDILR